MRQLRYTLLPDGISDRALIPILTWLLREHRPKYAIQSALADLRRLRNPPKNLPDRIRRSLELYPCDLLFIHRDAEGEPLEKRVAEIRAALEEVPGEIMKPAVCVVPVRMQEAWLLIDKTALRQAAGNPRSRQPLDLPPTRNLENLPDPKGILHELLRLASGHRGRRLKRFDVRQSAQRLADLIDDFTVLRRLSAFRRLEKEVEQIVEERFT